MTENHVAANADPLCEDLDGAEFDPYLGLLPLASHPPAPIINEPVPPSPAPLPVSGPEGPRAVMHARLEAMAQPRDGDDEGLAALRRVLRDQRLMAQVTAAVDEWPPLTDEQRDTVAALLRPLRRPG